MHVSLYVRNLAATVDFYTTFFGEAPSKMRPGYAKFTLAEPALMLGPALVSGQLAELWIYLTALLASGA